MPARYNQTNFLGGEWSPHFQGRSDHPKYRSAMSLCRNGLPLEEGAWTRRPGTRLLAPTYKGKAGRVYPFYFNLDAPYTLEFTDGYLRFFNNFQPVITPDIVNVVTISTANPAVVTVDTAMPWITGDEIVLMFTASAATEAQPLRQRFFTLTAIPMSVTAYDSATTYGAGEYASFGGINYMSIKGGNLNHEPDINPAWWTALATGATNTFSIKDSITGTNINGATDGVSNMLGIIAVRILRLATPYSAGSWSSIRLVQNQDLGVVLNGTVAPQALLINPNLGSQQAATASLAALNFQDGPYLDWINGSVATISGLSGSVSVTVAFASYDPSKIYNAGDFASSGGTSYQSLVGGNLAQTPASSPTFWKAVAAGTAVTGPNFSDVYSGFQATDVGRLVRFFSTPPLWQNTNYAANVTVYYNGVVYNSIKANSQVVPDSDPTIWNILPTGTTWTWGKITSVTNTNTVTVQIEGPPLLYNEPVAIWQLGVYSDTTGYPTCGVFYEGRFWFGGAIPNRFDASMVDGVSKDGLARMTPTLPDGTVADNCGIAYKLEAEDQNKIVWMVADANGIVAGTAGGEWLIQASTLNDPLTPASTKARRVTKYKCADTEPRNTGLSLVFLQKFKRKLLELLNEVYTGKYVAPNLSETAKHLTQKNIEEIAYQQELTPVIWGRTGDGKLIGNTFQRASSFSQEPPKMTAWHSHALGTGRTVESIAVGPSGNGALDALTLVTNNSTALAANQVRWVEQMTQLFEEDDTLYDAWFVDGGLCPDQMSPDTVSGIDGIRFTGLWYLAGTTVTVWAGGLDVGDFTVDANGTIFVPFGSGVAPISFDYTAPGAGAYLFTQAYINMVMALGLVNRNGSVNYTASSWITTKTPTSNPNGTTSKIQSFVPVASGTGLTGVQSSNVSVDWIQNRALFPSSGYAGIRDFDMTSGVELYAKSMDTITGGSGTIWPNGQAGFDWTGQMYCSPGSSNYVPVLNINDRTLTKIWEYGSSSNFGPPGTPGMAYPADFCVAWANAAWIISISSAGGAITFNSGVDGHFVSGNGNSNVAYTGYLGQPWALTSSTSAIAAGRSFTQTYVFATAYIACHNNSTFFDIFFTGVTDGVPTGGDPFVDPGSTGKKGKGKKGASPATQGRTPTIDNPITIFDKIGTIQATDVDPNWTGGMTHSGLVVDWADNSMIMFGSASFSGIPTYASTTVYWPSLTDPATFPNWDPAVNYPINTTVNDGSGNYYCSRVIPNLNHAVSDAAYWNPVTYYALYDATVSYANGAYIQSAGLIYVSIQAANVGHTPATSPTWWTLVVTATPTTIQDQGQLFKRGQSNSSTPIPAFNVRNIPPATDCYPPSTAKALHWDWVSLMRCFSVTTGKYSWPPSASPAPAGVKWSVPIQSKYAPTPFVNPGSSPQKHGRVRGGVFGFVGTRCDGSDDDFTTGTPIWLIDTTTGKYAVVDQPGICGHWKDSGCQVWDDQTMSCILHTGYFNCANTPTALNSTTFDPSITSGGTWYRLYVGNNLTLSTIIPSTLTTPPVPYTFIFTNNNQAGGFPVVIGTPYVSQGQTLRPIEPAQTGDRLGPAFGATRRSNAYQLLAHNTIGVQVGTDFNAQMYPALFKDENTGALLDPTLMYNGLWRDPLEDTFSLDSQLAWKVVRPYPTTVVAIGATIETQDG